MEQTECKMRPERLRDRTRSDSTGECDELNVHGAERWLVEHDQIWNGDIVPQDGRR